MASRKIRIMISSRCYDAFPAGGEKLSVLRKRLKAEIEAANLFGAGLFEVWTNEDAPPADAVGDSTDVCLKAVDDADILIILYNGNAGWASSAPDVGICHAEMMRGMNTAAGKVRMISLGIAADDPSDAGQTARNVRFQAYVGNHNLFRGGTVKTPDQAVARVKEAIVDALQSLTGLGVREARKGRFHTGEALNWSGLSFAERQSRMVATLAETFAERPGAIRASDTVAVPIAGASVLFALHAIPASLTVAAAREMVGRPFLRDHEQATALGNAAGPVHIIACQKGASETQATALLGFPDATIVSVPFGIYVLDPVQKVQFLFLQNCRDQTTTRFSVQRFFEWLTQSGEDKTMATSAQARARIVKAIASEQ